MRAKIVSILLLVPLLLVTLSCTQNENEWKGTIEKIDGITVVKNSNEPIVPEKRIEFIKELSIGDEEKGDDYIFTDADNLAIDSKGDIYVLDRRQTTIKRYNNQGEHIINLGRSGQGPGEFEMLVFIETNDKDELFALDPMQREIEVFNSDGSYGRTIKIDWIRSNKIKVMQNGSFLAEHDIIVTSDEGRSNKFAKVGFLDFEKMVVNDIFEKKQLFYNRIAAFIVPQYLVWDVGPDNKIYLGSADKYTISVFSSSGSLERTFSKEYTPISVSNALQKEISDSLQIVPSMPNPDEYERILRFYPIFQFLSIDESNRIWVALYFPREESGMDLTKFDVYSPDGKYLFSTEIQANIYPRLIFKNGFIYTLVQDESGFQKAVRFRMTEH